MTGADVDLPPELAAGLDRLGVATATVRVAEPLHGGVSSDIWRIETPDGTYCTKRALAVLKTAQRWEAPVERSSSEANWLGAVAQFLPDAVPQLLGFDAPTRTLLLEMLDQAEFSTWKSVLLDGRVDVGTATTVGEMLSRIHSSLAAPRFRAQFDNRQLFDALRLEPYIERTLARHQDLAGPLQELIDSFDGASSTVIHGDVSPKNVLVGTERVVLLDAECATWGDPAFDVAFCLTHLCAKAWHLPQSRPTLRAAALAFLSGYSSFGGGASPDRVAQWLPALLLARVDGASPLEYLSDPERSLIRERACDQLRRPTGSAESAVIKWFDD